MSRSKSRSQKRRYSRSRSYDRHNLRKKRSFSRDHKRSRSRSRKSKVCNKKDYVNNKNRNDKKIDSNPKELNKEKGKKHFIKLN